MPSKTSIGQNRFKDFVPPQNIFTDREEPQDDFQQALAEINQRDYNLLVFYGVGGIGKSYLQAHLKQEHLDKDANSLYSSVNFENPDNHQLQKTLRTLVHNFSGEPKIPFTAFGLAYMIYWEKAFPDQDIKKAGLPFLEEGSLLAGAADVVEEVGGVASVAMSAVNYVYNKVKQQAFDENLRDALKQLNTLSSEQIEEQLPKYFAYDIDQYQTQHPEKNIVIFIDTHEALWQTKRTEANRLTQDQWLRDGIIAQLPNVLFVISGREKIVWDEDEADNWGDYLNDRQHLLGNLSDDDARDFLNSCEITDTDIQDKIIADSEGVPFYLDLCMETYYRITQQGKSPTTEDFASVGKDKLFERFMRYLDLAESETLKVLAHARFYTTELFAQLVEQFKTGYPVSALSQLNQFSFISEQQGRFFIHDLMRKSLIQHQDHQRNQAVNQYLFEHYNQYLQDLDIKQLSETTLTALPEAFHHKSQICGAEELADWFHEPWKIFKDAAQTTPLLESCVQLIELAEEQLGEEHVYVGNALHKLAYLYDAMAKYPEAEPLYQRSLKVYERSLGKDHPWVATVLNNLAGLYESQGKYQEAEPLYQRSLKVYEQSPREDHQLVATTLNNLAGLYRIQGKYQKAEPLHQRSLEIRESSLGKDHPDVAQSLNNLAGLYESQGKYQEAEPLYQRSLEIRKSTLGKGHPSLATTLNDLAGLYRIQGKYQKAEPLYQRSLEIFEQSLGKDHPWVATTLNNLALLYESQGKYQEAISLYQRSLEIRESALGKDHPDVAQSLNNLAALCHSQGKYQKAEPLYQRSLEIRESALGKDHLSMATILNNLALLYGSQGKYQEAEPLYQRSLEIRESTLGKDHPDVAGTLNNLALVYGSQGKYQEAEPLYQRSLEIMEQSLEKNHPDVAQSLNNLAALYSTQGKYQEAEPLYQRSLEVRENILGKGHPDVAQSLNNMAALYYHQQKYQQALPLFERALSIWQVAFPNGHPDIDSVKKSIEIVKDKME